MDLSPVLPVSGPFFRDIHGCQIQHFQKAVIRRKNRLAFGHFPELAVSSVGAAYTSFRSAISFLMSLYKTNFVELRI